MKIHIKLFVALIPIVALSISLVGWNIYRQGAKAVYTSEELMIEKLLGKTNGSLKLLIIAGFLNFSDLCFFSSLRLIVLEFVNRNQRRSFLNILYVLNGCGHVHFSSPVLNKLPVEKADFSFFYRILNNTFRTTV